MYYNILDVYSVDAASGNFIILSNFLEYIDYNCY